MQQSTRSVLRVPIEYECMRMYNTGTVKRDAMRVLRVRVECVRVLNELDMRILANTANTTKEKSKKVTIVANIGGIFPKCGMRIVRILEKVIFSICLIEYGRARMYNIDTTSLMKNCGLFPS